MGLRKALSLALLGIWSLAGAQTAAAQAYPSKPIRVIVPFAAGGSNDLIGRALQQPLGKALNGTVLIENKPGAATKIGVDEVMKAAPDGHTLLFASLASTMAYYYSGAFDSKGHQDSSFSAAAARWPGACLKRVPMRRSRTGRNSSPTRRRTPAKSAPAVRRSAA